MGYRSRQQLSAEFLAETAQSYSPEFKAAMLAVMAHSAACLAERVNTAARYFSWGNASRCAVSDWDPARQRRLDQTDIALVLAILESGGKIHDITDDVLGPMRRDKSLRPKCMKSKHEVSRAFSRNEARGTIRCEGHRIFSDPVPVPQENQKLRIRATFDKDEEYLSSLDPVIVEDWRRRREELAEIERDLRTGYREYRKLRNDTTFDPSAAEPEVVSGRDTCACNAATFADSIFIDEEDCLKRSTSSSSLEEPTTTEDRYAPDPPAAGTETPSLEPRIENSAPNGRAADRVSVRPSDRSERKRALSRPPQPRAENGGDRRDVGRRASDPAAGNQQNTAVLCDADIPALVAAVAQYAPAPDDAFLRDFVRMAREAAPECTPDRLVRAVHAKGPVIRTNRHRPGYYRTAVINELLKSHAPPSVPLPDPVAEVCSVCQNYGFVWKGAGLRPERMQGSYDEAVATGLDAERGDAAICGCIMGEIIADRFADWKEQCLKTQSRSARNAAAADTPSL